MSGWIFAICDQTTLEHVFEERKAAKALWAVCFVFFSLNYSDTILLFFS
jgi:hypothetical protein